MLIVSFGERGPRVVWLQILLNRTGAKLRVDGIYGLRTRAAVNEFQRQEKLLVGNAGTTTFLSLVAKTNDQVIDVTDIGDPNLAGIPPVMESLGSTTVTMGAMSNGIEMMVREVAGRARMGRVALLRISGHGNLGRWMTASVGSVVHQRPDGKLEMVKDYGLIQQSQSFLSADNFDMMAPRLRRLTQYFAPYGSFEHTGCSLGSRGDTRRMMGKLADLFRVPVSAGVSLQRHIFRFDGAVVHAFPGGASLATWSRRFANASM